MEFFRGREIAARTNQRKLDGSVEATGTSLRSLGGEMKGEGEAGKGRLGERGGIWGFSEPPLGAAAIRYQSILISDWRVIA